MNRECITDKHTFYKRATHVTAPRLTVQLFLVVLCRWFVLRIVSFHSAVSYLPLDPRSLRAPLRLCECALEVIHGAFYLSPSFTATGSVARRNLFIHIYARTLTLAITIPSFTNLLNIYNCVFSVILL